MSREHTVGPGLPVAGDPDRPVVSARGTAAETTAKQLLVYCAAGMRYPLEPIVDDYRREYGVEISVQYGGSQSLLSQMEVSGTGRLVSGRRTTATWSSRKKRGSWRRPFRLATMRAGVGGAARMRRKCRPTSRSSANALANCLRNPDAAAIGSVTRSRLQAVWPMGGLRAAGHRRASSSRPSMTWPTTSSWGASMPGSCGMRPRLSIPNCESIRVPELGRRAVSKVDIGVLQSTQEPDRRAPFARYVAARDRGLRQFAEHHYRSRRRRHMGRRAPSDVFRRLGESSRLGADSRSVPATRGN